MPSFMVNKVSDISDFIIPLTEADAVTLTDWCIKRETGNPGNGRGYFAVYGKGFDGTPGKWAIYVTPNLLNGEWWFHVIVTDYHPRKEGKADIVFGK